VPPDASKTKAKLLDSAAGAAVMCGAPSGFRTPDPLIKSQLLYQLS
jgi:hypothetical protein